MRYRYFEPMICLILVLVTLAVYWEVQNHEFVVYDDNAYVGLNHHVQAGLTKKSVAWAFTTFDANFWQPLTWLSHMLDCQLFGLRAGMHHMINLLLHIGNSLFLFLVFKRMTGALWKSAFVAALFALHPLHVESVAWVAERKDVLSTFFWILTMLFYVRYVEKPGFMRYLLILTFFVLGLMTKPMLVTLPFILLLIDYWPLGRLPKGGAEKDLKSKPFKPVLFGLIIEKAPLFILAAVFSTIAFLAQGEAVQSLDDFQFKARVANALVSYVTYIGKMFWPNDLAVFYPYPQTLPVWQVIGSGLFLIILSVVIFRMCRRRPYAPVGWLWYLGTLVPVIGLVQVGNHAMGDRYTYIPIIGLFIIIAWGIPDLLGNRPYRKQVLTISAGLLLLFFSVVTFFQVRHWKDSIALFSHAIDVTDDNWMAHNNIGFPLVQQGRNLEAITHFSEAVRIKPDYVEAHVNLANTFTLEGRFEEAMNHFNEALRIKPQDPEVRYNLGVALYKQGKLDDAITQFSKVVTLRPEDMEAQKALKALIAERGK